MVPLISETLIHRGSQELGEAFHSLLLKFYALALGPRCTFALGLVTLLHHILDLSFR